MTPLEKQIHSGNKVQNNAWTFAYFDISVNMIFVQLTHLLAVARIRYEALFYILMLNITIVTDYLANDFISRLNKACLL